jgi:hypothetical protein
VNIDALKWDRIEYTPIFGRDDTVISEGGHLSMRGITPMLGGQGSEDHIESHRIPITPFRHSCGAKMKVVPTRMVTYKRKVYALVHYRCPKCYPAVRKSAEVLP